MKPQAYLLATASLVTLVMIGASSLQAASQQLFRNQTARVGMMTTMKLISFHARPVLPTASTAQLVSLASPSGTMLQPKVSLGVNQRFSLDNSLNQVEQMTDALLILKKLSAQGQLISRQPMAFVMTDAQLQTTQGLSWIDPAPNSLQLQDKQLQIQKLDLQLSQVQNSRDAR